MLVLRLKLLSLLPAKFLNGHVTAMKAASSFTFNALHWTSTNRILQRHPRLLLFEECKSLYDFKPLLAYAIITGLFHNAFVASRALVASISSSFEIAFTYQIFSHMKKPNIFSWNTMIDAFASSNNKYAFHVYVEMLNKGILPDKHTFPLLLKACHSPTDINLGVTVHTHAYMLNLHANQFVQTALFSMYLSCGSLEKAHELFRKVDRRDVVAWTAMISGLSDQGCCKEALEMFIDMRRQDKNVSPNDVTLVTVISACASLGSLKQAKSLHLYAIKIGLASDVFVGNSIVDMYAKCGSVRSASKTFEGMITKDLHSWTAMIMCLALHGHGNEALDLFSRMQQLGFVPDSITLVAVLSACSHAGLVDEGVRFFHQMTNLFMINPNLEHYGCMVDLFSRAGFVEQAYQFVLSMPVKPNLAILGSLLSSLRIHKNIELSEIVVKEIHKICHYKGGSDVLLSNIYAEQAQWVGVVSVRQETNFNGNKPPGWSRIEDKEVIHEFYAGYSSLYANEIHLVLDGLEKVMEVF